MNTKKLVTKTLLNSIPAVQFNDLIQDLLKIIKKLKTRYKPNFSLREFIDSDYTSLFKNRVNDLTNKYNELSYKDLNKDKLLREFRDKIDYKLSVNEKLQEIGKKHGLHYVYLGNVAEGGDTYCYNCNAPLVKRGYFAAEELNIENNKCSACKTEIAGIWGR